MNKNITIFSVFAIYMVSLTSSFALELTVSPAAGQTFTSLPRVLVTCKKDSLSNGYITKTPYMVIRSTVDGSGPHSGGTEPGYYACTNFQWADSLRGSFICNQWALPVPKSDTALKVYVYVDCAQSQSTAGTTAPTPLMKTINYNFDAPVSYDSSDHSKTT